ncbi:MAG TPA: hypothetical protein VEW71_06075 [Allosphingosinicella sp.]|nr:hypothetical protein [Allosphingosinicella sp.]
MKALARRLLRSKFFLFSADRMVLAISLITNSIILANAVDPITAGVYFFSTSLTQILVLPWIPALEMSWSGRSAGKEGDQPVPVFFSECVAFTIPSSIACLAILFFSNPRTDLFVLVSIPAVAATVVTTIHMLLVKMRYEETGAFVTLSISANLAALMLKVGLAIFGADRSVLLPALFSDVVLVALVTLVVWLRRYRRAAIRFALPDPGMMRTLLWSALSLYAMLFMGRSLLVFARLTMEDREYAATGFAFQLANAIMPLVSALMYTVRSHARHASEDPVHTALLIKKSLALAVVITAIYAAGVWLVGPLVVEFLMPGYADVVVDLLKFMIPYIPAALLAGLAIAIAPRRPLSITFVMVLTGLAAGAFVLLPIGGPGPKLLLWSGTMLAGSIILIWTLRPLPAGQRKAAETGAPTQFEAP